MERKTPSAWLHFTEPYRAIREYQEGRTFRANYTPSKLGNGQAFIAIPGFMASDRSTKPLRRFFDRIGYTSYASGMRRNFGKRVYLDNLEQLLLSIYQKHQEKTILLGWSLGGVYARELAKLHPAKVSHVITLASPFADLNRPTNATNLFKFVSYLTKEKVDPDFIEQAKEPPPVPLTCFYSKQDGVVHWDTCMAVENEIHTNIEVDSSHFGMGNNKEVLRNISEVLLMDAPQKHTLKI